MVQYILYPTGTLCQVFCLIFLTVSLRLNFKRSIFFSLSVAVVPLRGTIGYQVKHDAAQRRAAQITCFGPNYDSTSRHVRLLPVGLVCERTKYVYSWVGVYCIPTRCFIARQMQFHSHHLASSQPLPCLLLRRLIFLWILFPIRTRVCFLLKPAACDDFAIVFQDHVDDRYDLGVCL